MTQKHALESDERPQKLRKLSHDTDDNVEIHVSQDTESSNILLVESANESAEHSLGHDSRTLNGTEHDGTDQVTSSSTIGPAAQETPILSKNQQKKQKRKEEWEAGREDRKIFRKQKNKEKKARQRIQREEAWEEAKELAELNGDENASPADVIQNLRSLVGSKSNGKGGLPKRPRQERVPVAFVIDCDFDELMVEKEVISLGSQITRAYSDNSKTAFPVHLYVSSWKEGDELRKRFDVLMRGMYRNWKGIEFTEQDFYAASLLAEDAMKGKNGGKMVGQFEKYAVSSAAVQDDVTPSSLKAGEHNDSASVGDIATSMQMGVSQSSQPVQTLADAPELQTLRDESDIIYLTSDSPYTLTELKPYHTYIIGGIVDKNRHKGICYKRALDKDTLLAKTSSADGKPRRIRTAKLPIGEYMSMTARHVLTTNHVIEIMLKWLEKGDWGEAFLSAMPKRKGGVLKSQKPGEADAANGDGGGDEADDGESSIAEHEDEEANGVPTLPNDDSLEITVDA